MKRLYPLLLLLVVFAMLGKTTVTAFAPELTYSVVSDWSEESETDDEAGDDDKVVESADCLMAVILESQVPPVPLSQRLESLPREIPGRPPQA